MTGLHLFKLDDAEQGGVLLAVAVPRDGDPWGVLAPLRATAWGPHIREVSGESMAHARHGFATPLMREIGPHPQALLRRIPDADGWCSLRTGCAGYTRHCRPGRDVPDCYEPPKLAPEVGPLAARVTLLWKEGRYVVVVIGGEFNLR